MGNVGDVVEKGLYFRGSAYGWTKGNILYTSRLIFADNLFVVSPEYDGGIVSGGFVQVSSIVIGAKQLTVYIGLDNSGSAIPYERKEIVNIGTEVWTGANISVGIKIQAFVQEIHT